MDRRCRQQPRDQTLLRGAVTPLQPGGELPARAGLEARRSSAAVARQRHPAVGDHAGGDEARRGGDPRHHAADAGRVARSARSRPRQDRGGDAGSGHEIFRSRRRRSGSHRRQCVVAARGLAGLRTGRGVSGSLRAGWADPGRRPDAAVFHLRHHGQAKTGAAQPAQLSRRRSLDHVLARAAAGRCASEHFLAGLGQARLELPVRAVECRRHRVRGQPAALRRQGTVGDHRALRRDHAVRAADGVAAVHPGEARDLQGVVARSLRRRRAAQSRSDRSGPHRMGADDPRRLRPDRNHGAGR